MKKVLLCILSLFVLLGTLTACGRDDDLVTDSPSPAVTDPLDDSDDGILDDDTNDDGILDDDMDGDDGILDDDMDGDDGILDGDMDGDDGIPDDYKDDGNRSGIGAPAAQSPSPDANPKGADGSVITP